MSHQSLYRKYRPALFSEVVGQDHVTSVLAEQIRLEKIPHAFLFSGSRGLGKTSIARIFAKELGTSTKDIYEIDAASNNSVEDIRSLTENVHTLPFESRYKVYILDEVHMLSKSAWNAFLKTLEEPPAHTIFIMATTELEKVPETVRSRCQVFELKRPTRKVLAGHIEAIAKKEKRKMEPGAVELIALLADSSYRDALSILEKILSLSEDGTITREAVEKITGAPRYSYIATLVDALSKKDTASALTVISEIEKQDIDFSLFLTLLLEHIRTILLLTYAPELQRELEKEIDADVFADIQKIAKDSASNISDKTLLALLDAASRMRYSPIKALPLELAVLSLR
jgi:DNA polymerase III subunit gamma/tau